MIPLNVTLPTGTPANGSHPRPMLTYGAPLKSLWTL